MKTKRYVLEQWRTGRGEIRELKRIKRMGIVS